MLHTIGRRGRIICVHWTIWKQSIAKRQLRTERPVVDLQKHESFNLFRQWWEDINQKITAVLMRAQIPVRQPEQVRQATAERRSDYSKYRTQKADYRSGNDDVMRQDTRERQVTQPIRAEKTVGRNDPCPCGSGKKYKNCCGR